MFWDNSLESGVPVIDFEHKELIVNLSALKNESDPEGVRDMLKFLEEYVVKHFAHEQVMHKRSNYPKTDEHRKAHEQFVQTFLALEKEYLEKGSNPDMLQRVIVAVENWLRDHILGQDREFSEYYKKRYPNGEAFT